MAEIQPRTFANDVDTLRRIDPAMPQLLACAVRKFCPVTICGLSDIVDDPPECAFGDRCSDRRLAKDLEYAVTSCAETSIETGGNAE